jgi:uncharacterized protein (DUF3084 family)
VTALLLLRSHWKLIGLGILCLLLAVQSVRLGMANNRADGLQVRLNEARAELERISTAKNEQKAETSKRVDQADKGRKEADKVAEQIEAAPTAPDCQTPSEILGADL